MERHDATKETTMNTNENTNTNVGAREEVIDLGVASIETKGHPGFPTEGVDLKIMPSISEE
jgi:hypothetical protein